MLSNASYQQPYNITDVIMNYKNQSVLWMILTSYKLEVHWWGVSCIMTTYTPTVCTDYF